jgi:hypothetical protein
MSNICLKLSLFKIFALIYSRVGAGVGIGAAGARAASKFLPGAGAVAAEINNKLAETLL